MHDVNGKVALVTGGASGMGQIIARRLAGRGAKVAIFDVNEDGLAATAAEADNITAFRCDISCLQEVEAKVAEVEDSLEDVNDELSGRVIIIVQQNPVEAGPLELLFRFDLGDRPGVVFEPLGHAPF